MKRRGERVGEASRQPAAVLISRQCLFYPSGKGRLGEGNALGN